MKKEYAPYNSLMRHMRKSGIHIAGSNQKRHLQLVGYYHGYKGYRFNKEPKNIIPFSSYMEMRYVIDFDESVKSIMYLPLMQLESAIKSISCEKITSYVKSSSFTDVFEKAMTNSNHEERKQKLRCRDSIYSTMTRRFSDQSKIVCHYYNNEDQFIPLWAIFEELTLGDLSTLIERLKPSIKLDISAELGIPVIQNTDGKLLPKFILKVKDFRNAIAHNKVVFDGRYSGFKARNSLCNILESGTEIPGIQLDSVTDDIILIIFLMKNLRFNKTQLLKVVTQLIIEIEKLFSRLEYSLYKEIIPLDAHRKLISLKKFISKTK